MFIKPKLNKIWPVKNCNIWYYMKSGNPDKTIKLFLIYHRLSTRFVHAVKVTWHQCSLMLLWLKKNWDGKLNVDLMKCVSSQRSAKGSLFQVFGW